MRLGRCRAINPPAAQGTGCRRMAHATRRAVTHRQSPGRNLRAVLLHLLQGHPRIANHPRADAEPRRLPRQHPTVAFGGGNAEREQESAVPGPRWGLPWF